MRILIANDDGVNAPGLAALHQSLSEIAQCVVVAPEQDRSGASSSLTLDKPLHPQQLPNGFVSVDGTPTDCVHLALNGLLSEPVDLVVAGINLGANLGDDVLYSGTVAAALEGRFLQRPAFAFSLVSRSPANLPSASYFAKKLIAEQSLLEMAPRSIFNVNVPDLPLDQIKGVKLTRLGHRARAASAVKSVNPRGKTGYWLAAAAGAEDGEPGTDFHAISQGYVAITPLQLDRTYHAQLDNVQNWLEKIL